MKMGSDERDFNVSLLILRGAKSQDEKGNLKQGVKLKSYVYQPNDLGN